MYRGGADAGLLGTTSAIEACADCSLGGRGIMGFESICGCEARLAPVGEAYPFGMPYADIEERSYGGGGRDPAVGEPELGLYSG